MSKLRERVLKGIGANSFGQATNVVVQLVTLPFFLVAWGPDLYGEWIILSSLAAFLSMSDIGFATVAANEMATRAGSGDQRQALVVYQSMWVLLTVLGCVTFVIGATVVGLTRSVELLPLVLTSHPTATLVLVLLFAYVLIGQFASLFQAGFRCDGNYALGQMLSASSRFFEFAALIATAALTKSMIALALAILLARLVSLVVFAVVLKRRSEWLKLGTSEATFETVRRLTFPAISFLGVPLGNALSIQGIVQVVAVFLGPGATVIFTAHRTICNVAHQAISIINHAVWPELSMAYGADNILLARTIHRRACQLVFWISISVSVMLIVVGPTLFSIWTQDRIVLDYPLFLTLLLVIFIKASWMTSSMVLLAINQHKVFSLALVVLSGITLLLSTMLIEPWGLLGVGVSLMITDLTLAILVLRRSLRVLGDKFGLFFAFVIKPPFTAAAFGTMRNE